MIDVPRLPRIDIIYIYIFFCMYVNMLYILVLQDYCFMNKFTQTSVNFTDHFAGRVALQHFFCGGDLNLPSLS